MEGKVIDKVGGVSREVAGKISNDSLAIFGIMVIALAAIFVLGNPANEIVAALGGGLVGYLARPA